MEIPYSLKLSFPATNNMAEYDALLARLLLAKECLAKHVAVYSDSELVVNQVRGNFEVSNPCLARYLTKVRSTFRDFDKIDMTHISRTKNEKVDQLAKTATIENPEQYSRSMREILTAPSIEEIDQDVLQIVRNEN
ncbi:hypothetical protein Nepgr_022697 [Nepenthes gracilis]|uniref:RNase H type-1 domain-containing protein n=1 Tax=Nepenthes gracilis TaxID=150966 RepID=A0AAD3T001_NEPGR|nr:hypothetical protein Nepgr_022697 [Nepenthes gracilis]